MCDGLATSAGTDVRWVLSGADVVDGAVLCKAHKRVSRSNHRN